MGQNELLALIEQAAVEGWSSLDLSGQGLQEMPGAIAILEIEFSLSGSSKKRIG